MSEFVPVVTEGMDSAVGRSQKDWLAQLGEHCDGGPEPEDLVPAMIKAALAHEDFQRQLRAYVAEQMRGLVPEDDARSHDALTDRCKQRGFQDCRAETLTNIAKWESSNGQ